MTSHWYLYCRVKTGVHRIVSASISVKINLFKVNNKDTMEIPIDVVLLFLLLALNRYMLTGVFMTLNTFLLANTEQKIEFYFKDFCNKCDHIHRKLPNIYLFIYLSIYLFIYLSIYLFIYLFIHLLIHLFHIY